ncbi:hypothetical protein VNO77_24260 [Canavalia gladiata]|uniref:Uncharacterized protein n=1 Tax=Canavalia gladiata TaxID=3824 RepID=A0AAN9L5Y7_CANGL
MEREKESCKQNPRRVSPSAGSRQARFGAGVPARFCLHAASAYIVAPECIDSDSHQMMNLNCVGENDNVWDMGNRESDVGEVQSEDGFTCGSSTIRSQIEPRQYHFIIHACFPAHPNSSDSLVGIFPRFINLFNS